MGQSSSAQAVTSRSTSSARVGPAAGQGAVAGILASVVMAAYAIMASASYQHHGSSLVDDEEQESVWR